MHTLNVHILCAVVTVLDPAGHPANTFTPAHALGAGVDGHEKGEVMRMLSPANVREMLSAGLQPLSYRLRTELAAEAWHWNPRGSWSDSSRQQGYWTSSRRPGAPIELCYGYRLPRRGATIDQANNDGYSRIDDGDPATFWKSNPYLDRHFTGEDNARHPQWLIADFGRSIRINAIRVLWGSPWATRYTVEYARGDGIESIRSWQVFPRGSVTNGRGGEAVLHLGGRMARFVRVRMTAASGTAPAGSMDIRDRLGYAVREIRIGTEDHRFHDLVVHAKDRRQTVIYVSSTDPWHRASDRDDRIEQPGFDLLAQRGLTRRLPMLTTVSLLYGTPENAVAEIQYLRSRGYPVERVEMGEEPDGQWIAPEDYGALYAQWAEALYRADPRLQLGGPGFAALDPACRPWMDRFLAQLRARHRLARFQFFSFEWYPFDEVCDAVAPQLRDAAGMLRDVRRAMGRVEGRPWVMTEYGYSAFGAEQEVDLPGALLNADTVGLFLTLGGDQTFLYGYEPNELLHEVRCTWGNNMMLQMSPDPEENGRVRYRTATYHAARLLTAEWLQPSGTHRAYRAESDQPLVSAYAVRRPDRLWAILLINKDPKRAWPVRVRIGSASLRSPVDACQFSAKQYVWRRAGEDGHPARSEAPEHISLREGEPVRLPPWSLTVVRGSY